MFPNIDNKLGLTAVRKALNARENKLPSTTCILEAVKNLFEKQPFCFQGEFLSSDPWHGYGSRRMLVVMPI